MAKLKISFKVVLMKLELNVQYYVLIKAVIGIMKS